MSATWAAVLIAGAAFFLSLAAALITVGIATGQMRSDIAQLKASREDLATKAQVDQLGREVAEIKGMFRVTLKTEHGGNDG